MGSLSPTPQDHIQPLPTATFQQQCSKQREAKQFLRAVESDFLGVLSPRT